MSSSLTTLMTCWAGVRYLASSAPVHRARMRLDEVADDGEVDVGLEKGDADFAEDLAQPRRRRVGRGREGA